MTYVFTSESVSDGHPDKVADQLSDAILDAHLEQDRNTITGLDLVLKSNVVVVTGEIKSQAKVDIDQVIRDTINDIGYEKKHGFSNDCTIIKTITGQSPELTNQIFLDEQGAGDQGIMFGYASNETPQLMPLPIQASHDLLLKLREARKLGEIPSLGPDAKSQVTVRYENGKPIGIDTVVISTQHDAGINLDQLRAAVKEQIILPVLEDQVDSDTKYLINPLGSFVVGGPVADAGLTGRKIIVDTYGGFAPHGGGAFSGKDASKVDRSATYAARNIAKNIVAANLAERCQVQLAYAIGVADPVSVNIDTFGTGRLSNAELVNLVHEEFALKPGEIIRNLDLKSPIYKESAAYGAFGREQFSWEKVDSNFIKNYGGKK
jgi:S-adenosylmethionine synthetase